MFPSKKPVNWFAEHQLTGFYVRGIFVVNGLKGDFCRSKENMKLPEAGTGVVLWKKMFLKISQYLQENPCVGVSF